MAMPARDAVQSAALSVRQFSARRQFIVDRARLVGTAGEPAGIADISAVLAR